MSNRKTMGGMFLAELESEAPATRKCLERIPESIFKWKPHEKSMEAGYLGVILADIPRWITLTIEKGVIDFGTFERWYPQTTADLLAHFDKNMEEVKKSLLNVSDESLQETFSLKNQGQVLMSLPKFESISSSINHWVHHRGQMTVYMRLNNIPVPSIYGPSADDKVF